MASPQAAFNGFCRLGQHEGADSPGRAFQLVGEIGADVWLAGVVLKQDQNFLRLPDEKRQNLALKGVITARLSREVAQIEYLR
jgi:hypothetical protein